MPNSRIPFGGVIMAIAGVGAVGVLLWLTGGVSGETVWWLFTKWLGF